MRYAPAAAALSLALTLVASTVGAAPREVDPRAAVLLKEGSAALAAGDGQGATDAFEAALAVDPANVPTLVRLGDAARANGLQGKAIGYYRLALDREPANVDAIAGEGAALAEKGAIAKAKEKLALVQKSCGKSDCAPAAMLSAAIAKGPLVTVKTAEATPPSQPKVN